MKSGKKTFNFGWAIKIFFISFCISAVLSSFSGGFASSINLVTAFIILIIFIVIGIIFDILGTSITSSDKSIFNSMASKRVKGAATALKIVSNADVASNFCNDVIGDISGVLSGTMCIIITEKIIKLFANTNLFFTIFIPSFTSAFIVGGKALGKNYAIKNSEKIVMFFSKMICFFIPEKKRYNKK